MNPEAPPSKMTEKQLYEMVSESLRQRFVAKNYRCHLEVTAYGRFTELLKQAVKHDIIFSFLKSKRDCPDITGYVERNLREDDITRFMEKNVVSPEVYDFVTIEIKKEKITLEHIYQAKRYADLFKAKYGFLLTTELIPEEIKRLSYVSAILSISQGTLKIAQFSEVDGEVFDHTWFPDNPFVNRYAEV